MAVGGSSCQAGFLLRDRDALHVLDQESTPAEPPCASRHEGAASTGSLRLEDGRLDFHQMKEVSKRGP